MHFGILATACDQETLLTELRRRAGQVVETTSATEAQTSSNFDLEESEGRCWVTDRQMILTTAPDLILQLSQSLPEHVIAYYAQTLFGSFGLVDARGGKLRRFYYNCHATLSKALSIGAPYPFEAELESLDGGGAIALLEHYGLIAPEQDDRPYRGFYFTPYLGLRAGPLQVAIAKHEAKYTIPPEHRPGFSAVGRIVSGETGNDSAGH
jgi:hypothetical protein